MPTCRGASFSFALSALGQLKPRILACVSVVLWVAAASQQQQHVFLFSGQVAGVVKQSPPPRGPRFERRTGRDSARGWGRSRGEETRGKRAATRKDKAAGSWPRAISWWSMRRISRIIAPCSRGCVTVRVGGQVSQSESCRVRGLWRARGNRGLWLNVQWTRNVEFRDDLLFTLLERKRPSTKVFFL